MQGFLYYYGIDLLLRSLNSTDTSFFKEFPGVLLPLVSGLMTNARARNRLSWGLIGWLCTLI
jgi:hypothetical protein